MNIKSARNLWDIAIKSDEQLITWKYHPIPFQHRRFPFLDPMFIAGIDAKAASTSLVVSEFSCALVAAIALDNRK